MSKVESFICRPVPRDFEAVRFPNGGNTQCDIADWVESLGWEMPLWDGNAQKLDQPADDGSMWRYFYAIIRNPDDRHDYQTVVIGDYIIYRGDGDLIVVKPWEYNEFYEEVNNGA